MSNAPVPHSGKRFVYFGTPYVGRDTLAALVEAGYVPELVVTSPDAPSGRGHKLTPCETKEWALAHNLPVETPERIDAAFIERIAQEKFDYAIVVAYGKILPRKFIALFPQGVLNVHYSLLPKYRGASPVEEALLQAETVTGVSIQKMVFALDAGDILAQKEVEILPLETTRELRPRLVAQGAQLLIATLPGYLDGSVVGVPQDESHATHSGKISKQQGELTLTPEHALTNWHKYRAYAESPGTYFFMNAADIKKRVKIVSAVYENDAFLPVRVIPEGKGETDYSSLTQNGWKPL